MNIGVWITIMIVIIVGLNALPVKYYGESEFWFASLKVICLVGLLSLGFILFWGGGPDHDRLGFRYADSSVGQAFESQSRGFC